jgi:HEAT repeat protein
MADMDEEHRKIVARLRGGDRRSVGRAAEVVKAVLAEPRLFAAVFEALSNQDDIVRMRAADVIEKVTTERPDLLQPYKRRVLREVAASEQMEVRWHAAQLLPRLALTRRERAQAMAVLTGYLSDTSSIVRTFALQALADLATQDPALQPVVLARLEAALATGSPAMRSRARRLLARLKGG